eukprot:1788713-Ditylum_brightwellii.AAC.1
MRKKSSTKCNKLAKRDNIVHSLDNWTTYQNLKIAFWMMVQTKVMQENHMLIQAPLAPQKQEYADPEVPEYGKTSPNMHKQIKMLSMKISTSKNKRSKKS